jgi:hypothetical protein
MTEKQEKGEKNDEKIVWQEALGISEKGTCLRHPSCPILVQDNNSILTCKLCTTEEKAVGIQQRISFAAVVKQLQTNTSSKNVMAECEAEGDLTKPAESSEASVESLAPHLIFQQTDNLASTLKRLSQVQNWMLRTKEKEVLSLKMQISKLEQRLADSETTVIEQHQTIRALRRTIQQDLKLIKTMATQKQLELEAEAEYEAQLQQGAETDDDTDTRSSTSMTSPHRLEIDQQNRRGSPDKSITSPFPPQSRSNSPSPQEDPRLQGQMKFFQRASRARAGASVPNRGSLGRSRSFEEGIPEFSPASRSEAQTPTGSTYMNDADVNLANDPSKLFASFRGGLLDIPKEPPKPHHATERNKFKIGVAEKSALQVPVRGVLVRTHSAEPTDFPIMTGPPPIRKGKKKNKITVDSSEVGDSGEMPIDMLTSSLNALPLSRGADDQSPDPISQDRKGSILPPPPMGLDSASSQEPKPFARIASIAPPNLLDLPSPAGTAQSDDDSAEPLLYNCFFDDSVMAEARTAKKAAEEAGLSTEKFLFSVSNVQSRDKYGDSGRYTGTFLVSEGLPHGTGKMNYDSGRLYSGDWINGQWNGKGKLLNPNGDTYEGEFVFDARHGKGVYKWDNGDVYTGMFREDKRHGQGKFAFHNGNVYEGEFCDGMFEGFGRYKFDGGYYEGEWKEGRYDGNGELVSASGSKYTGEFKNSVAHGLGMEVSADGKKKHGVWENGHLVE